MTRRITVVGAGVIGLTTALELAAAGHDVTVISAAPPAATTSAVAGAVWFPYHAGPPDRVVAWAARSRARWQALAADRDAGVDLIDGFELAASPAPPWWLAAVADARRGTAPVPGAPAAWCFTTPRVEPARFLPWAEARLPRPIVYRRVSRLADVDGDRVVNCTGLAARALTGDAALHAVRGQIAIAAPGGCDLGRTITDDRPPGPIFYVIPRRGELVLGGTTDDVADDDPGVPDPAVRARILAQARQLGLAPGPVLADRVGLRPARPEVRLEVDPADRRIVHHYGHGGAGYTLAWGCAEDVAALCAAS